LSRLKSYLGIKEILTLQPFLAIKVTSQEILANKGKIMNEKLDKIIELLEKIEVNTRTFNGYAKWSYEQDELVDIMYTEGKSVQEIIAAIKDKFGIDRSDGAITSRVGKLGLNNKPKKAKVFKEPLGHSFDVYYEDPPF